MEEIKAREEELFLAWFSGFVAGEGCFVIRSPLSRRKQFRTEFSISLRDDDLKILLEIQERFQMGLIRRYHYVYQVDAKPGAEWRITKHSDCKKLAEIFERHPLRARKQEDFEIWKIAVAENQKPVEQRNLKKMKFLREKIRLVRAYEPGDGFDEDLLPNYSEVIQLELPWFEEED